MITSAVGNLVRGLRSSRNMPVVLMYHRVADEVCDPWDLAVSPENFDNQLAMLKDEREVIPLADFAERLTSGTLPSRATAITFDDGYACNAYVAAQLLQRHQLPATFFITTGAIGIEREYWWDELATLVIETQVPHLERIQLGSVEVEVDFSAPPVPRHAVKEWRWYVAPSHQRLMNYMNLWKLMRPLPHTEQRVALDALWKACGRSSAARGTHRVMTFEEVRKISCDDLFTVEPHTVTHPALGGCSESNQSKEITRSRDWCEEVTSRPPTVFAYPYGDLTALTAKLVKAAGFSMACTTQQKAVNKGCSLFSVPRLQVLDIPAEDLLKRMAKLSLRDQ
jgi:peptidoglycan/xylan/chitin deacetylase (PgdA/CDA1 family)